MARGEFTGRERLLQLPFRTAFQIAIKSIEVRFWRSMITAGGIFLGIAFLSAVLTSSAAMDRVIALSPIPPDKTAILSAKTRSMWLIAMSLIVSAVGISNSMLMSVTERFKEIGTMKCLGALDTFVYRLFMIEAGLLGMIASALGWLLGFLLMFLVFWIKHGWEVVGSMGISVILKNLGICLGIGIGLTLLATYFPAKQAARLPAAAALRTEI